MMACISKMVKNFEYCLGVMTEGSEGTVQAKRRKITPNPIGRADGYRTSRDPAAHLPDVGRLVIGRGHETRRTKRSG